MRNSIVLGSMVGMASEAIDGINPPVYFFFLCMEFLDLKLLFCLDAGLNFTLGLGPFIAPGNDSAAFFPFVGFVAAEFVF